MWVIVLLSLSGLSGDDARQSASMPYLFIFENLFFEGHEFFGNALGFGCVLPTFDCMANDFGLIANAFSSVAIVFGLVLIGFGLVTSIFSKVVIDLGFDALDAVRVGNVDAPGDDCDRVMMPSFANDERCLYVIPLPVPCRLFASGLYYSPLLCCIEVCRVWVGGVGR